ncbi:effector binding domain-containing protein [Anaerolentibacter hominis]|uniref:effector binding domain-containing protein n=1 Tax=Anaerolentibacter hominis TaxID=3079009 RepID=UPI0031B86D61
MNWSNALQNAIDYMEDHMLEELDYGEIAKQACSSNFHFQRVFGILCGCTLGEYIRSRRLTLAGNELKSTDCKVIDIALKYGYDSPESFARAFSRFHGVSPTAARSREAKLRSFSRLSVKLVLEGGITMDYRIEKRDAFQVIARKERFPGGVEITADSIHKAWEKANTSGTIEDLCRYVSPDNIFGKSIVGICFDNPLAGDFDYAIGAAYSGGEPVHGLTVEEVPAGTWAVFPCTGAMPDAFQNLWKQIYTEFFPTSAYQPSGGMCIEVYPGDEIHSNDFHCEIWLSVAAKE